MSKSFNLGKVLGLTALIALVFQLMTFGVLGVDKASAQTASTTTLTVTKVVDNTAGGTAVVGDFTLSVTSETGTTTDVISGDPTTFEVGAYTITETNIEGYAAAFSGDCAADGTITLEEGVAAECTITNTFEAPATATTSLTVIKVVDGGDLEVGDVSLFINDTPVTSGVPLIFAPGTVPTAPLTVSETEVLGYTATFSGDCDINGEVTIEEGEELTCTITNTFDEPVATTTSLTITKVVEGGGELTADDFPLFIDGMSILSGVATTTLGAGTFTITETSNDDFTATFSGDCAADGTITLTEGMTAECTITNTFTGDPVATTTSLTVTKVVDGGNMTVADFPLFVNGMSITSGVATTTLAAGTFFITETGNANYAATFSGDCAANGSITLAIGVDSECTITNTFIGSTGGGGGGGDDDDDDDRNITINVDGSDSSATGGEVNINVDGNTPFFTPFPGQVLGAQSFIPATAFTPFSGQVLGAQSAVPGFPSTGGDPTAAAASGSLPNLEIIALAGLLATAGAGLMLTPRTPSVSSGRNRGR